MNNKQSTENIKNKLFGGCVECNISSTDRSQDYFAAAACKYDITNFKIAKDPNDVTYIVLNLGKNSHIAIDEELLKLCLTLIKHYNKGE